MIESTCRWPLELSGREHGVQEKMNSIQPTERKIGTIKLRQFNFVDRPEIYEMFRKRGVNVVKLVLLGGYMDSIGALADLLHLMPNLKHAVINIGPLPAVRDLPSDYVLPDMKKLKKLEWSVCDQRFIKCFRKANLTTIIIKEIGTAAHYDSLVDFISSQDTLMSLTVKSGLSGQSILAEMGKLNLPIPIRLTKLAVNATEGGLNSEFDYNNVSRFIKSQKENLKHVTIWEPVSTSVYESLFALTNMDTLGVSICQLPSDKNFYEQLAKNRNVRTIELRGHLGGDVGFLCNFFELFPNVRTLVLRDTDAKMNNDILLTAQSLSKLESLSMGASNERSFGRIKFCNLKALHIGYLSGKIDWDQFTKMHSRLTELSIRVIYRTMFSNDNLDQIVANVDLQSIRLGGYFKADDRFSKIIQAKCKNLKMLNLCDLYDV